MKSSLNVVGVSLTVGLCAVLLSGCDGRMGSGFKSTNMQELHDKFVADKAAADRLKNGNVDQVAPDPTPEPVDQNAAADARDAAAKKGGSPTPDNTADTLAEAEAPVDASHATIKTFLEKGDSVSTAKLEDLLKEVDQELPGGKSPAAANKIASAIVQGIDIKLETVSSSLVVTVDARTVVRNEKRNVFVKQNPVKFSDPTVPQLQILVAPIDNSTAPVPAVSDTINGFAFCREAACTTINLVLQFQNHILAVFALSLDGQGNTVIVASNLGDGLKSFADAAKADVGGDKTPEQKVDADKDAAKGAAFLAASDKKEAADSVAPKAATNTAPADGDKKPADDKSVAKGAAFLAASAKKDADNSAPKAAVAQTPVQPNPAQSAIDNAVGNAQKAAAAKTAARKDADLGPQSVSVKSASVNPAQAAIDNSVGTAQKAAAAKTAARKDADLGPQSVVVRSASVNPAQAAIDNAVGQTQKAAAAKTAARKEADLGPKSVTPKVASVNPAQAAIDNASGKAQKAAAAKTAARKEADLGPQVLKKKPTLTQASDKAKFSAGK